ncbi:MAG TPA: hypothetical protein VFO19_14010, partial [Vicinamibacterales bacterium]|nr:hypothetical protein [Vicinamibacterales bacterium]
MSRIAIVGAGPIGGAIAHALAERERVREVRLIDDRASVAAGKALDIRQTGPIDSFDTRLDGSGDALGASGASVIVIADRFEGGEWQGDEGLALVRKLVRAGTVAPIVFAGPAQTWLMEKTAAELGVAVDRLVGTAASALPGAVRGLVALELNASAVDVAVAVAGRPPAFVIGWSAATAAGSLVADRVPAHRLLAISDALRKLWPPGPQAIAAATAPIVEALANGSRRQLQATAILDGEWSSRGRAALLTLEITRGRIARCLTPSLSPQERTAV